MRSIVYERFGQPEDVLKPTDRSRPEPGPGQALVRMLLSPIHNHDLMTAAGAYGIKPALPAVGGTEAVGVVEAVGEGVSHLQPGSRVMGGAQQTWAEYFLIDAVRAIPVPEGVSDETACQLIAMPLSAKMILAELGLKRGDWLVQNAGNGAVAKLVSRFGAEQGIHVLSLVRRAAAVEELRATGIETAVATDSPDWSERARTLIGDGQIMHGIESLGGDGASQLAEVMADGAKITSFGAMTGRALQIPPGLLLFRRMTVNGFWAAKPTLPAQEIGRMVGELVRDAAEGRLDLPVGGIYPLDDIAAAVRASGEAGRTGKIVLKP